MNFSPVSPFSSISNRVSAEELAVVLNVTERTVRALAKSKQIPSLKEKNKLYFDFNEIVSHFKGLEGGAA